MGYGVIATAWALWRAETMKLRGTMAPWLAVAAPLFVTLLDVAGLFESRFVPQDAPATLWPRLMSGGWTLLLALCVPAVASFEAASLANLEHSGKQWKQVFAYPIPRWSVYAMKMAVCAGLSAGTIVLGSAGLAGGMLLYSGYYDLHMAGAIPCGWLVSITAAAIAASLPLAALQTWVSSRVPGVAAGLAMAIAATIAGVVMLRPGEGAAMSYYPWTMPFRVVPALYASQIHNTLTPAIAGAIEGVVAAVWACRQLGGRREVE